MAAAPFPSLEKKSAAGKPSRLGIQEPDVGLDAY